MVVIITTVRLAAVAVAIAIAIAVSINVDVVAPVIILSIAAQSARFAATIGIAMHT